jgi:hypothetical protein
MQYTWVIGEEKFKKFGAKECDVLATERGPEDDDLAVL